MSVLVKDMKMPKRCLDCPMYDHYNYNCQLYAFGIPARYNRDGSIRPEWCELVELPEKHGRLIDADALADDLEYDAQHFDDDHELKFNAAMWLRSNQNKVIIEAER